MYINPAWSCISRLKCSMLRDACIWHRSHVFYFPCTILEESRGTVKILKNYHPIMLRGCNLNMLGEWNLHMLPGCNLNILWWCNLICYHVIHQYWNYLKFGFFQHFPFLGSWPFMINVGKRACTAFPWRCKRSI